MFDYLTTGAIADEIDGSLVGGKIQRIGLRDRSTVVAEVYAQHRRQYLVTSIHQAAAYCLISQEPVTVDAETVTPFSLLLRKYLRGGRIVDVHQPPLDRLIRVSIAKRREPHNLDAEIGRIDQSEISHSEGVDQVNLYIEIMGRRSNVILTDADGVVLDALKRVDASKSTVRPILPGREYQPPPPPKKITPNCCTGEELMRQRQQQRSGTSLAEMIVRGVSAFSPQMAAEVVYDVTGDMKTKAESLEMPVANQLASAIRELVAPIDTHNWSPSVYLDDEGNAAATSAVQFRSLASKYRESEQDSMSACLEMWLANPRLNERHAERRSRLQQNVEVHRQRIEAKLHNLEQEVERTADRERYRRWGEGILASLHELSPRQEVLGYGGEEIPLDPNMKPADVAQEYFARYRRDQRGDTRLVKVMKETRADLAQTDQMLALVGSAETFDEIENLRKEWDELHEPSGDQRNRKRARPVTPRMKTIKDASGNTIYVGRTAAQNERVTFEIGSKEDWWLHARGTPGAHVLVKSASTLEDVDDRFLLLAAALAAHNSSSREDASVEVDICRRKDVRKLKGNRPGLVTYRNERTVNVKPLAFPDVEKQITGTVDQ